MKAEMDMIKEKRLTAFILLLSIMAMMSLFGGCVRSGIDKAENSTVDTNKSVYNDIYELSEFLTEEQYDEYMNDDGSLFNSLLEFRKSLVESSEFEFYAYCNNYVEVINSEMPETCIVNYDTEFEAESKYVINGENITATEAIQVSENFFTLFPIEITEGRCFQSTDFDCHYSEPIPVILGTAYHESFHLGDTFEAYYIGERRSFTVIGFIDEESVFYQRSERRMESYERYIVMPFESIEEDSASSRAILLQQICGFIELYGDHSFALQTIQGYLKDTGLEDWNESIVVNSKSIQEKMN